MTSFRQLEALVAVVETGSFERAAAQLGIAQSAISRHIKEFESRFEYPLFDRSGRAVRLTLQGGEVLARAQAILRQRDVVVEGFLRTEVIHRSVRLGVTELCALTWLPQLVAAIRERYPSVNLQLEVDHSITLYEKLRASDLDVVVVPDLFGATNLTKVPLSQVRHIWCCSPSLDVPKKRIRATALEGHPLLIPGPPSGTGAMIAEWLNEQGLKISGGFTSGSLVALAGMAVSGLGIAFLPMAVTAPFQINGLLRELVVMPRLAPLRYVAMARTDVLTPFFEALLALTKESGSFDDVVPSDA
jgi:DNA-binding transcriptional LysR family regulator